jgi:heptosyltransferase-2
MASPPPRRVAIIQPLPGIGDALWHLGACRALARAVPGGRVDLVTRARAQADRLFRAEPWLGEVITFDRDLAGTVRLVAALRRRDYDRAYLLHHSPRLAIAMALAGIRERFGFGFTGQRAWLNRPPRLDPALRRAPQVARWRAYLAALDIALPAREPPLALAADAVRTVDARFGALARPAVALAIGASEPWKQWGAANFAALADTLAPATWPTIFLVGGAGDAESANAIRNRAARGGLVPACDLPIEATAALLARCALAVGNDTGALNLAAAVAIPAIGLFGATPALAHEPRLRALTPPGGPRRDGMSSIATSEVSAAIASVLRAG